MDDGRVALFGPVSCSTFVVVVAVVALSRVEVAALVIAGAGDVFGLGICAAAVVGDAKTVAFGFKGTDESAAVAVGSPLQAAGAQSKARTISAVIVVATLPQGLPRTMWILIRRSTIQMFKTPMS